MANQWLCTDATKTNPIVMYLIGKILKDFYDHEFTRRSPARKFKTGKILQVTTTHVPPQSGT
jgi:hypothetical protein